MLVEMLHVPAPIDRPIELQHLIDRRRLDALRRSLAQTPVDQTRLAVLLKPLAVASELALRHSQQLPGFHHR